MSFTIEDEDNEVLEALVTAFLQSHKGMNEHGAKTVVQRAALRIGMAELSKDPATATKVELDPEAVARMKAPKKPKRP